MQVTLDDMNMTGRTDKVYCVQYHEIIYELCGPWLGTASWVVNVLALVGLAVAQVIACASNMHRLSSRFTKRYTNNHHVFTGPQALPCMASFC